MCMVWTPLPVESNFHRLLLYNVQQRARPQFEQKIKRAIRARGNTAEARKKFTIHNPVLDKEEYIQPPYWLWPKVITTIVILSFMVSKIASACMYNVTVQNSI